MDQPSNGLNAAYDLACRYNSLFQYNPSAVYGLFNASKANTHSNQTTSIQKPTSSPTSSLSSLSSSSSSLNNNNTQSSQLLNNANNSHSNELSPKSTSTGSDSAFKSSTKTDSNANESANQINEEEEFDDVTTNDIKLDEESNENGEKETPPPPTNGEAKTKLNEKQRKPTNSYESVSDSGSMSDHIESSSSRNESPISSPLNNEPDMDKDVAYHEADVKEELYQANEEAKAHNRSLSASSSLASSRSSLLSDANQKQDELNGDDEEVDDTESVYSKSSFDKMQHSMSLSAKKALASYFEASRAEVKKRAGGESDDENGSADEHCEHPAKKLCVEPRTDSAINKIANHLQLKLSSSSKSVELDQSDLIRLKEELLVAVGQAIQSTLDSFYDSAIKSAKVSPNQCSNNKPNSSANANNNNSLNENLKKLKQQQPAQHHHKSKIRIHEKSNRSFKPFHSSGSNSLKVMDKTNGKIYDLKDKRNANSHSAQLKVNKTAGETIHSKPAQLSESKPHSHHHLPLHASHSTGSLLPSSEQISAFSSTNKSLLTAASSVSSASSPNSNPSLLKAQNPISSAVNQFYTAAMNHLQQQNNSNSSNSSAAMQSSTPSHPNFNYNHLASNGASPAGPFPSFHGGGGANPAAQFGNGLLNPAISSVANGQQSSLAGPSGLFGQSPSAVAAAHHQFLLSAAAAAAANQNTNYLHMAAAANRLFTPYLLDHHQSSAASKSLAGAGLQSSVGSMSKPNASSSSSSSSSVSSSTHHHHHHQHQNPHFGAAALGSSLFHTPTKRRRTKVTDTRLSPRNPTLRTGGVLGVSSLVYSSGGMGSSSKAELSADAMSKSRDHSPSQSCNDNDDQENFNQDYEGNEYQDEERGNQDDETVSSNGNDSSNNGGQLATMPNGYPNGGSLSFGVNDLGQNSSLNNDMGSTSNEYVGYQISFLNRKFIFNYF